MLLAAAMDLLAENQGAAGSDRQLCLKTKSSSNQQAAWFFLGLLCLLAGCLVSYKPLARVVVARTRDDTSSNSYPQRRETESDPPRRQDRPEDLEAADVHVLRPPVVASES